MEENQKKDQKYTLYTSRRFLFLESKYFKLGIVLIILILVIIILNSLNITSIKVSSLPQIYQRTSPTPLLSPSIVPSFGQTQFSSISGNPFEGPARIVGTDLTLEVISGRVSDLLYRNNGVMIYLQKTNGEIISKPFFAPNNIKPILATGKFRATEKEVKLGALKKGDLVMISFMEDIKTKQGQVSGVRITR